MVYGEWDDVHGTQFVVIWGEAGQYCTVLILSGYDYGGGVLKASSKVPVKEAEEVVEIECPYERYRQMNRLVDSHNIGEYEGD